jgi:hypothetical protein
VHKQQEGCAYMVHGRPRCFRVEQVQRQRARAAPECRRCAGRVRCESTAVRGARRAHTHMGSGSGAGRSVRASRGVGLPSASLSTSISASSAAPVPGPDRPAPARPAAAAMLTRKIKKCVIECRTINNQRGRAWPTTPTLTGVPCTARVRSLSCAACVHARTLGGGEGTLTGRLTQTLPMSQDRRLSGDGRRCRTRGGWVPWAAARPSA